MRRKLSAALSILVATTACVTVAAPGIDPDQDPANPRAPTAAFTPIVDPLMDATHPMPLATSASEPDAGMAGRAMHAGHESHEGHEATQGSGREGPAKSASQDAHAAPSPAVVAAEDSLVREYLASAAALAKDDAAAAVSHIATARAAAHDLAAATSGDAAAAASRAAQKAPAETKDLEMIRKEFKGFSEAVIALVRASPPTDAVAPRLRKAYCPMADAAWLQTETVVANPYFGGRMPRCGDITETIATKPAKKGE